MSDYIEKIFSAVEEEQRIKELRDQIRLQKAESEQHLREEKLKDIFLRVTAILQSYLKENKIDIFFKKLETVINKNSGNAAFSVEIMPIHSAAYSTSEIGIECARLLGDINSCGIFLDRALRRPSLAINIYQDGYNDEPLRRSLYEESYTAKLPRFQIIVNRMPFTGLTQFELRGEDLGQNTKDRLQQIKGWKNIVGFIKGMLYEDIQRGMLIKDTKTSAKIPQP